jgi:hypothetical protein
MKTTQQFDLAAFKTKRDAAQGKGLRWEATAFEIASAYKEGERDLRSANLRGANLYGANLYGANLEDANLEDANLEDANLYGANLYGANLEDANLEDANLEDANLEDANLRSANLRSANLYGANLEDANLYGANLDGANGIYSAYAPNLSSRGAALTGGVVIKIGKVELRFWAGCKECITAERLLEYVQETHEDNIHAKQYRAAIQFIQACFDADMEAGKWDYLLELEANKGK